MEQAHEDGLGLWQAVIKTFMNDDKMDVMVDAMATKWHNKLNDMVFTRNSTATMGKHLNNFNEYYGELKIIRRGRLQFPETLIQVYRPNC